MKRLFIILISTIVFLGDCKKDATVRTSGTATIDNTILQPTTNPHVLGFSFSQAKLASSLSSSFDIAITLFNSKPELAAKNFNPSFFKVGDYATENEAKTAFDNLKTVPEPQPWGYFARDIVPNQIWIYRSDIHKTDNEKYTKIRIIEVKTEKEEQYVVYAECTFEWVHQPDGSLNFP